MKLEPYLEQRRTHGNSGPIPCPQCGKLFAKEFDIKRHMFTHTGEKPFKCDICNRGFSQKSTLKVHLNIHTGDMPYSCQMCGKKFRQKQGLNAHVKANRCKFGNIKPTGQQQPQLTLPSPVTSLSPLSSGGSDSSNSPRAAERHRPYPTMSSGNMKTVQPKEKVFSSNNPVVNFPQPPPFNPLALLKLLSSQQASLTPPPPPQFMSTLPTPPSQLSLTGLQNLSQILAKYREAQQVTMMASMQSTTSSSSSSELNNSNEEIDVEKADDDDDMDEEDPQLRIVELDSDDALSDKSDKRRGGRRKQANPSKIID